LQRDKNYYLLLRGNKKAFALYNIKKRGLPGGGGHWWEIDMSGIYAILRNTYTQTSFENITDAKKLQGEKREVLHGFRSFFGLISFLRILS
jgi:hypothetical protein